MKARYALLLSALCAFPASAQLVGFYNIGGPFASYDDLTEAFDDLMTQGATGDITFLLHPGTYTGQASLGVIPGNPGVITVKSSTNNAADAILAFDAVFPLPNHIIRLDNANNVKFEDVTFHALNADRARCIHFTGNTDNLKLWDCVFIGSPTTNTNSYFERVLVWCNQNDFNVADNPDNLQVLNCAFRYGYQAIEIDAEGNGGARAQGIFIGDNTLSDQLSGGITVNSATGEIGGNRITTSAGNFYVGIRTNYFDAGSKVYRNVVQAHATVGSSNGMEIGNTQNTTGNQIHNNMITVSAANGECWGLGVYNLWDMSIIWNSVAVTSGSSTSKAFYHLSNFADGQDCVIRNNLFVNYADGPALESIVAGNIVTEDHNGLFTTGSAIASTGGVEYTTLAAYQSGTGDGANDLDIDPAFPFLPDLHVNSCALDGTGEWFPIGLGDIDYEARGNPVCDIGADEFTYSSGTVSTTLVIPVDQLPFTITAGNGSNYLWSNGSTAQSIAITQGGPVTCQFTDANGCTYTAQWNVSVDFSTGLPAMERAELRAWPNPATEAIMITGTSGRMAYTIHDANGRLVGQGSAQEGRSIDVRALATGLHVLRLEGGHALRFMKQ
jgi:hypothetical protein